jgi:DNA helicase-2/ATP-dependent DNA helicase PcrA
LQEITILSEEEARKAIIGADPELNDSQKRAITTLDGPMQIIAGPGSGKTKVLVLRALYILLTGQAQPKEIIMTTFMEKAAFELRDRLLQFASKLEYKGPLNEMRIGTIHSVCDDFIRQMINDTPIKRNYEVLDDITHSLFISDNFRSIFPEDEMKINGKYLRRWTSRWITVKKVIPYFNKITEELIDVDRLLSLQNNLFLFLLGKAYHNYERTMHNKNKIDFAHQQKILIDLLQNPDHAQKIKENIKYIMVDEYQDTNYIQEQILLTLANPTNNICIVGDEDQSLYRFRGATIRNILEFKSHFANCQDIILDINYRSHIKIIDFYNKFMKNENWSNHSGEIQSRFDKVMKPNPKQHFEDYPAVITNSEATHKKEGEDLAKMVVYLKNSGIIEDYSQVALLLHTTRSSNSEHFVQALKGRGIPCFNPRAKAFLYNEEIMQIIGCYAFLFHFRHLVSKQLNDNTSNDEINRYYATTNNSEDDFYNPLLQYVCKCQDLITPRIEANSRLAQYLKERVQEIDSLQRGQTLDMHLVDYFYELLAYEPFSKYMLNENSARNLATFSDLITTFQNYYRINVITEKSREDVPKKLFRSFFKFLLYIGKNDYEDPDNPIPKGYVQIMTVHQAKGLEFPVVVVGSRGDTIRDQTDQREIDKDLAPYYHRLQVEPEDKIAEFDKIRQYYVAFSRAEKLLVLSNDSSNYYGNSVSRLISPVCSSLPHWQTITTTSVFNKLRLSVKKPFIPKKSFSFTSHINPFETCPRQYRMYHEYKFSPSRSATMAFGILVHQTIEDIHKKVKEKKLGEISNDEIKEWFENNYRSLLNAGKRPLSEKNKMLAFDQVLNYFIQNYDLMRKIFEYEVDIQIDKPNYILKGKIDLLMREDGSLEILDFKTQKRPDNDNSPLLKKYYNQLYTYAHIINDNYKRFPDRIYLYWTDETDRDSALMQIPFDENELRRAEEHFDFVVNSIQNKDFAVKETPAKKVCRECDFRNYCNSQGTISLQTKHQILMAE